MNSEEEQELDLSLFSSSLICFEMRILTVFEGSKTDAILIGCSSNKFGEGMLTTFSPLITKH
jgi:hypothetical protein